VISNGQNGICLRGSGHLVKNCTAIENQSWGIYAYRGSTIIGNTVCNNQGDGIRVEGGCTVTGNTVTGSERNGIYAYYGCTVTGNTVRLNNLSAQLEHGGIRVMDGCLVKGNTVRENLRNSIYVGLTNNAVEENLITVSAGHGIYFNDTGNFYANNRASDNATKNYAGTTGQTDGGGNYEF
jgi:parallel beta-helix repeat protein